ncbi:MAG TPA: ATP phosphoribosyltransferase [Candidatus Binataceae bacterium]|jgi:ATP phosphoribosyltransferase|nr:ATP phosphoribosyltransferase [Candidatus Binataceae bacterium]
MSDKILKFGIPKGSLEAQTLELLRKSGWRISVDARSYMPKVDDPTLSCRLLRPQEMPRYIADGSLDAGITGRDWVVENDVDLVEVESFTYSKVSLAPTRWVVVVPEASPVRRLEDLEGKRVATEMVNFTRRTFAERKIKVEVEFSWGATEAKAADGLVDAAVEVTETGSSLRANGLRIVEELLTSTPVLVASPQAWADEWKQFKIKQVAVLVRGALDAEARVGIKMNCARTNLIKVIELLPSITAPTVSPLYPSAALKGEEWVAVETVISEQTVRELFPKLLSAGAVGIIEFPLNKII